MVVQVWLVDEGRRFPRYTQRSPYRVIPCFRVSSAECGSVRMTFVGAENVERLPNGDLMILHRRTSAYAVKVFEHLLWTYFCVVVVHTYYIVRVIWIFWYFINTVVRDGCYDFALVRFGISQKMCTELTRYLLQA